MSEPNIVDTSVAAVKRTAVVPYLLEILCRTTGLGFASVARVTPERWIACEVRDEISFGLISGGELKADTTLCHEVRQKGSELIIDDVAKDEFYSAHRTPAMYGFQSYISVPIWLDGNVFFGTLCAIDPRPALLKHSHVRHLFQLYARLIAFLMDAERSHGDNLDDLKEQSRQSVQHQLEAFKGLDQPEGYSKTESAESEEKMQELIQQSVVDMEKLLAVLKKEV